VGSAKASRRILVVSEKKEVVIEGLSMLKRLRLLERLLGRLHRACRLDEARRLH
jgi:hypothetical protein